MKLIKNIVMIIGLFLPLGIAFSKSDGRAILDRIEKENSNPKINDNAWEHSGPTREDILASKRGSEDKLISAVKKGDLKAVKILLAAGTNVDVTDDYHSTALFYAVEGGHAEIVKLLIANGAAKNQKNFGELFVSAVFKGNSEVVKALLVEGSRIDQDKLKIATGLTRNPEIVNAIKELLSKTNC